MPPFAVAEIRRPHAPKFPLSIDWYLFFTSYVLGTIGQYNTYFFLLPLIQCLMSLGQNQISYSILLGERNSFLSPLYVGANMLRLPVLTLASHIVPLVASNASHRLAELGGNLAMCHLEARQLISSTEVV